MLSLGKILLLVIVIGGAWFGYRIWRRYEAIQAAKEQARAQGRQAPPIGVEMVKCISCGTYVPKAAAGTCANCGRAYAG
jgi:hypothetical protein